MKLILPFVARPWLGGTWSGVLTSYRIDKDTKEDLVTTHDVIVTIDQKYTDISITLHSAESKSRSICAELKTHNPNDYTIFYQYDNTPKVEMRHRSVIHRGGTAMEAHGASPLELSAEYWTNRDSKGTFELNLISREIVGSFKAGRTLKDKKGM